MEYLLPKLRAELSAKAGQILEVENVVVDDANPKFDADLAIPCFEFASQLKKTPQEIAQKINDELKNDLVIKLEVAGGFLNIWLDTKKLAETIIKNSSQPDYGNNQLMQDMTVLVEHTDPNPFKELHIGHLYQNTVGEAISRLHEAAGAKVHRLSYHGDVGLHIAKAVWGIEQMLVSNQQLSDIPETDRSKFLGQAYALGASKYEEDETIKSQITSLNQALYELNDPDLKNLYETARSWSFEYFNSVYQQIGVGFEKQYFESQTGPRGLEIVNANLGRVFEASDGAVVFRGEDHDLHTRVFINSKGLPTYEAKDLALAVIKDEDYHYDKSIVITAHEQTSYFKVMLKALEQIYPELAAKTVHLASGEVRLPTGRMHSRSGDVITAVQLLNAVEEAIKFKAPYSSATGENVLGAFKYAFLKQNIGGDVVYDVNDSISLEGQTGPYIQYAAVRIQSILDKVEMDNNWGEYDWEAEKALVILIAKYPEVVELAVEELAPHRIAQFVYDLAKEFNRYYEKTNVKDAPSGIRIARISTLNFVLNVLRHGMNLLNIPIPERM